MQNPLVRKDVEIFQQEGNDFKIKHVLIKDIVLKAFSMHQLSKRCVQTVMKKAAQAKINKKVDVFTLDHKITEKEPMLKKGGSIVVVNIQQSCSIVFLSNQ